MDHSKMTAGKATPQALQGPLLMIIRGLPGSGKTYLAAALQKAVGSDKVILLDPDAIKYASKVYVEHSRALTAEQIEEKFHPYRFLRAQAHQAITDHKVIIWNQPFTLPDGLQRTLENLAGFADEQHISLPVLLVEIEIDPVLAKQRIEQRKAKGGHGPSDNRFARFIDEYTSFAGKGYPTMSVSGKNEVSASVSQVIQEIQKLYRTKT